MVCVVIPLPFITLKEHEVSVIFLQSQPLLFLRTIIPNLLPMKYRSRTDIVANILQVAEEGAIKTRIMYGALLSFPQLKEYLELLIENGLLQLKVEDGKYYTTSKGGRFLRTYKEIGALISPRAVKSMMAE